MENTEMTAQKTNVTKFYVSCAISNKAWHYSTRAMHNRIQDMHIG